MFDIASIKSTIIIVVVAFVTGMGVGSILNAQANKASRFDNIVKVQDNTAESIAESITRSDQVQEKVNTSTQQVQVIRKVAAKRIKEREKADEFQIKQPGFGCTLDTGLVSLLNTARDGTSALHPDSYLDAKSKAPSAVGLAEFVDNDLEVVQLYRELAINHNDLVEQVREYLNKQQGN